MNYKETLDYLYNTLPMFSRMGSVAYKKDLTNTIALCKQLDDPHKKFKSIHIGGTNGKGSVSHMLAAVLQTAGYKTGLYTSPHLKDFRERIKINGLLVDEKFVVDFVEKLKPIIEEIQPSFFEITVAMAFDFFAKQNVDVAVIEVGLGGRLDSTNIINPELSIITNIGYDHMQMLGNSLKEIGNEKAGIIKEKRPVVIGEKGEETDPVFIETAKKKEAPIYFAQDNFSIKSYQINIDKLKIEVTDLVKEKNIEYTLDLPGIYQTKNLITVLSAIDVLQKKGWKINNDTVSKTLIQTKKITGLKGRWDVVHKEPTIVLEVAHNEDGMKQMLQHLENISYQKLHLIIGMVKDKDVEQVLQLLPSTANYYFTQANIPRALDKSDLEIKAANKNLKGAIYDNVNMALQAALKNASANDLIIVCGSIFLVAEVDEELIKKSEF